MRLVFTCGNPGPDRADGGPPVRRGVSGAEPSQVPQAPIGAPAVPATRRPSDRAATGFSLAGNSPNRIINAIIGRPDFY